VFDAFLVVIVLRTKCLVAESGQKNKKPSCR